MNGIRQRVLVAGLTGQLGHGVVEASQAAYMELIPVVRPVGRHDAPARIARLFNENPALAERTIAGNVSEPMWGVSEAVRAELAGSIDVVLNLASETNWSAAKRALHATNALGAVHGHALAESLAADGNPTPLYCWTGSVFAAGSLRGVIPERPFPAAASRTAYEQTKWLGERALMRRSAQGSPVPAVIARIGGLVGNSRTGATAKRNTLYLLPDAWDQAPCGVLPFAASGRVDTLPRDVAADALLRAISALRRRPPASDLEETPILHICAGETAPTAAMLLSALRAAHSSGPKRRLNPIPVPEPSLIWASENLGRIHRMSVRTRNMVVGLRYLSIDRTFDRARLSALLEGDLPVASAETLARMVLAPPTQRFSRSGGDPHLARYVA